MLSALCWVSGKAAKAVPAKYEPTEEEIKEYEQQLLHEHDEGNEPEVDGEAEAAGPAGEVEQAGSDDEIERKFRLDTYDDDDDDDQPDADIDAAMADQAMLDADDSGDEDRGGSGGLAAVFGGSVKGLMYHASNDDDPYITLKDEDESESDIDDYTIRPSDALLVAVHTEDELSHLDVYVYEEEEANLYVHHDLLLPTFPLCLEWLDFRPSADASTEPQPPSNMVAVGTFQPGIEIWDLDVVDAPEATLVLGGEDTSAPAKKKKKKKKGSQHQKRLFAKPTYKPGSHTDAVMSLSWNRNNRRLLASGSADQTVKVWQLDGGQCVHTFSHHSGKVQAVQWHPHEAPVLLSGSYERERAVSLLDVRYPQSVLSWRLPADVEALTWNVHAPHQFLASSEDGQVTCFDVRSPGAPPVWQIAAHTKAVSALALNPVIPELLATCSTDKSWKIWDLAQDQPKMMASRKHPGALFAASFYHSSPLLLAVGGQAPEGASESSSEERLAVHDLKKMPAIVQRYHIK